MFDPATLPMASPDEPTQAAWVDTNSSGIDVPKPTTVSPITILLNLARWAMATAPSIKKSPPFMRRTKPINIKRIFSNIFHSLKVRQRYKVFLFLASISSSN